MARVMIQARAGEDLGQSHKQQTSTKQDASQVLKPLSLAQKKFKKIMNKKMKNK